MIAGGIVVLLPGRLLVAAVEDAIFGFSVTASGRVLQVLLTGAAIISGVAIGLGLAHRFRLDLVVDVTGTTAVDVVRGLACAAVASLATAVAYRSPRRLVLPPVLIGVIGYAIYGLLRVADLAGPTAATAAAAVVVGLLARLVAARMTAPALVLSVPALSTLLPGLAIFRAMSLLSTDPQAGIGQLFLAMATALAIGAGVALGDVLAAPADRMWLRRAQPGRHRDRDLTADQQPGAFRPRSRRSRTAVASTGTLPSGRGAPGSVPRRVSGQLLPRAARVPCAVQPSSWVLICSLTKVRVGCASRSRNRGLRRSLSRRALPVTRPARSSSATSRRGAPVPSTTSSPERTGTVPATVLPRFPTVKPAWVTVDCTSHVPVCSDVLVDALIAHQPRPQLAPFDAQQGHPVGSGQQGRVLAGSRSVDLAACSMAAGTSGEVTSETVT